MMWASSQTDEDAIELSKTKGEPRHEQAPYPHDPFCPEQPGGRWLWHPTELTALSPLVYEENQDMNKHLIRTIRFALSSLAAVGFGANPQ